MSPREKKLLILFLTAGFLLLNFLGIAQYRRLKTQVDDRMLQAQRDLERAELFRDSREQVLGEMDWLAQHEPAPAAKQDIQAALQAFCTVEARDCGLEVRKQDLLSTDPIPGSAYHRAGILIQVTGTEAALYEWLYRLNTPDKLRHATQLILSVNPQDEHKIDCRTTIEQWFVPASSGA